jgi:hypothetical protein
MGQSFECHWEFVERGSKASGIEWVSILCENVFGFFFSLPQNSQTEN